MNCLLMGKEKIVHTQRVVMFTDVSKVTRNYQFVKWSYTRFLAPELMRRIKMFKKKYLLNANFK